RGEMPKEISLHYREHRSKVTKMHQIATPIWNQIAREQSLETQAAKLTFPMNDQQLTQLEDLWVKLEQKSGTPESVALYLPRFLPFIVEQTAILSFLNRHPNYRDAM